VLEDLGIEFSRPYVQLRDDSNGVPFTEWFVGGQINIVSHCLGRHRNDQDARERTCLVSLNENGERVEYTFRTLAAEVDRCANALRRVGIEKGDRVAAYMPMISEVAVQMLACLQIGAIFVPVFSGYAPAALAERIRDAGAKLLFTSDVSTRRGKKVAVLPNALQALDDSRGPCDTIQTVVIVKRSEDELALGLGRDVAWSEFLASGSGSSEITPCDSMDPALILYTSGTTGRPKGTVHSHAGTLVQLNKEVGYAFDLKPEDRFFWFTDIGWMMGPWAIIGGLSLGSCVYLYEGGLDYPTSDQLWRLLAEEEITVFGISPTAIRMLMGKGDEIERHDLSHLRILGSTGEPWDPESWQWYFQRVGGKRCPVINISGGTDIIGCFLSPLPIDPLKPCSLVGPGLGMSVEVWNEAGQSVVGEVGYLVATKHSPSMTRGLWRAPERYLESYWSRWPDVWNHGDWAIIDEDGQWFLQGRSDDTLKVAGRRIGPSELEGALIETGKVSEAAAVGVPDDIKGSAIVCFVVLAPGVEKSAELLAELENAVVTRLGKVDRPEDIVVVADLPKTRSAKILRRMVRAKYLGEELGDLASVQNPEALNGIPERHDS
jgi:acetyl-CoA synthetase